MACLNTLKLEIKTLEKIFTKNHERFQILNSSVDELTCRFIGKNGKRYDIHANITIYPKIDYCNKRFFESKGPPTTCKSSQIKFKETVKKPLWTFSGLCFLQAHNTPLTMSRHEGFNNYYDV
uniref:Uncharacterized protein n=1 Tax=Glossina austeni TaxID=7395 RepID=A0A1A9URH5_GLOAU